MKGFKATYNYKCRDVEFSVNETYTVDELKMCKSGFHFCSNIPDTFNYYPPNKDLVLLEVEALGKIITQNDKHATDKIKILREIPRNELEEYIRFDSNNNMIYYKDSNEFERWQEYDSNNNLIYSKDSNKFEYWYKYDSNNNLIHYKNSNGSERWQEYDSNNNMIHYKNSSGFEVWSEFDSNNNLIYYKNSSETIK